MPRSKLKAQKLQAIRDLAAEWGKAVAEQALSGTGSDQQMDFHAMEQIATAAAAGLTGCRCPDPRFYAAIAGVFVSRGR